MFQKKENMYFSEAGMLSSLEQFSLQREGVRGPMTDVEKFVLESKSEWELLQVLELL